MNKNCKTIIIALSFSCIGFNALAQQSPAQKKGYGFEDINKMCQNVSSKPERGMQFDGNKANPKILNMPAGKYIYPDNGVLVVYKNDNYLIKLPRKGNEGIAINGTDGDDLLIMGGIVGGCFKEQLSEVIRKNNLELERFTLVKAYK